MSVPSVFCCERETEESVDFRQNAVYTGCGGQTGKGSVPYGFKVYGDHPEHFDIRISRSDIHIKYTGENK